MFQCNLENDGDGSSELGAQSSALGRGAIAKQPELPGEWGMVVKDWELARWTPTIAEQSTRANMQLLAESLCATFQQTRLEDRNQTELPVPQRNQTSWTSLGQNTTPRTSRSATEKVQLHLNPSPGRSSKQSTAMRAFLSPPAYASRLPLCSPSGPALL